MLRKLVAAGAVVAIAVTACSGGAKSPDHSSISAGEPFIAGQFTAISLAELNACGLRT